MTRTGTIICLFATFTLSCGEAAIEEVAEPSEPQVSVVQHLGGSTVCGDGVIGGTEVCDDGNTSSEDWCASDCLSGIDTTGTVCSTQGVLDLIGSVPPPPNGFARRSGPTVNLPSGAFIQLCDPDGDGVILPINSSIALKGNGTEFIIKQSVVDQSSADKVDVFHINAYRTKLEHFTIRYQVPPPVKGNPFNHDSIAIKVNAPYVTLRDLDITGAGTGILAQGGGGPAVVPPIPYVNINGQHWENIVIFGCYHTGFEFSGIDASAGYTSNITVLGCVDPRVGHSAVGMIESSANGNTHVAHLLEGNEVAIRVAPTGGAAPSTFVGVYVEQGDEAEWIGNYSTNTAIVGGHLALRGNTKGDRIGGNNSKLTFREGDGSGNSYVVKIPDRSLSSAFSWTYGGAPNYWSLKRDLSPNTYRWGFKNTYISNAEIPLAVEVEYINGWKAKTLINNQSVCDYGAATCGW